MLPLSATLIPTKPNLKSFAMITKMKRKKSVDADGKSVKIINCYEQLDRLGKGSFGDVFLCLDRRTGTKYAMKIINRASTRANTDTISDSISREIAVLKKLRHRNLVILKECIDDPAQNQVIWVKSLMNLHMRKHTKCAYRWS